MRNGRGRLQGALTMTYAIGLAVLIALIVAIARAADGDRYATMTEEEYEAEAQRSSRLGAAVAGLQKVIDPSHRAEYLQEQARRPEADAAEQGDTPQAGRSVKRNQEGE
jgi:hypothetical protein